VLEPKILLKKDIIIDNKMIQKKYFLNWMLKIENSSNSINRNEKSTGDFTPVKINNILIGSRMASTKKK